MMENELIQLLSRVLTSWQVWAATIAILLFWSIVFYVANPRVKRKRSMSRIPRVKAPKAPKPSRKKADVPIADEDEENLDSEG